ncbi:uncharacterized protein SPSK_03266 [Sporothrix schenckii 1099-18]|uniref:Uncharacterized protein n=1 Tax=Sporothrix schenckii 1099-18 TaxID=1397361 RepID=A0A0F2LYS7_SPOSC|nr:uncharacterized protein SPSK_03266 [Sporothrix schenckii 1099-18]KJR81984.1 hypothetical protein SPSK_03266 [Sporothrix schenckii 1099-18]
MATQVDFIGRGGSFKSFRPWRHRDQTAAGQAAGHRTELESTHDSAQETHGDDTAEAHSTDVNVSHVVRKERPPPAQRENHRPRALLSPSTSPSTSPSCPSQRISASHPAQADILLDDPAPPLFTASSAATDEDAIPRTPGPSIILSQEPEAETEPESEPEPDASLVSLSSEAEPSAKMPHASPPSPPRHAFPRPSLKRRRDLSDVDGPNTAALCCKKRRLRRFLITSRLSQPFSQPATHILNRESVAAGDKRFLKLAAIMNAKKLMAPAKTSLLSSSSSSSSSSTSSPTHTHAHAPMASEVIWRAAMANRLRQRLYAEATAASTAGRPLTGIPLSLMANMANARFTIVPVSTAAMAGRATTAATTTATTQRPATPASPRPPLSMYSEPPGAGSSAVFAPAAALSRSAPPLAAHRPIVRAVSRSPKLRPVKDPKRPGSRQETQPDNRHDSRQENHHHHHHHTDDDSDCVFAFPANEHSNTTNGVVDDMDDDVADDGSEEIYADFSVLFSSATAGDELDDLDGLDGLDALDGLDDYMDELDGIAHLPR